MTKTKTILKLWTPVILWAGLIFFLSSIPTLPSATKFAYDFVLKKTAHVTVYAILYFFLVRAITKKTRHRFAYAAILTILYAISDEIHQSFVSGRHASLYDVYFDSLGVLIVFLRLNFFI